MHAPSHWLSLLLAVAVLAVADSQYTSRDIYPKGFSNKDQTVLALPNDSTQDDPRAKYAYCTLLFNDEVLDGARVLGRSLIESGTSHDMVAIVTERVSDQSIDALESEHWIVKRAGEMPNPHGNHPLFQQRLGMVFSKLNMYNLTEYDKVVYLDTDTMVLENVDELFQCPGYCACVRNAFFNTGVMVFNPSERLFLDLVSQASFLPSYNGGEQGLMNSYFADFDLQCPMFGEAEQLHRPLKGGKCARLPAYYNGDIGPYYLHNAHWVMPHGRTSPKIVHFTLGPFKPWQWWPYLVFDVFWSWYRVYERLPVVDSAQVGFQALLNNLAFVLPIGVGLSFVMAATMTPLLANINSMFARSFAKMSQWWFVHVKSAHKAEMERSFPFIVVSICFFLVSTLGAFFTSWELAAKIPMMHPTMGMTLFCEWFAVLFGVISLNWLWVCYIWGQYFNVNGSLLITTCTSRPAEAPWKRRSLHSLMWRTVAMIGAFVVMFTLWCVRSFMIETLPGEFWAKCKSQGAGLVVLAIMLLCMSIWMPMNWLKEGRLKHQDDAERLPSGKEKQ